MLQFVFEVGLKTRITELRKLCFSKTKLDYEIYVIGNIYTTCLHNSIKFVDFVYN